MVNLSKFLPQGVQYFECSAKESVGVDEPFYYLANCLYEQYVEQTQEFQNTADMVWALRCPAADVIVSLCINVWYGMATELRICESTVR